MGVSSWLNVEVVVKRVFFIYLVFIENKKSFGVGLRIYKFRTRIYLTCEWLVAVNERVGRILAAAGGTRVRDFDLWGVRACYNR